MFDRSVLFVGAAGVGVAVLAEALASEAQRTMNAALPLRVHSATTSQAVTTDPALLRAMSRMKLDTDGLSMKPLALFTFAGAPRVDHVVLLGTTMTPAMKVAFGSNVDVRQWKVEDIASTEATLGSRYLACLELANSLRDPIEALVTELSTLGEVHRPPLAHSA